MSTTTAVGWWHAAACRDLDTALFYVSVGQNVSQAVKDACRTCPVVVDCLTEALEEMTTPRHDRLDLPSGYLVHRYGYRGLSSAKERGNRLAPAARKHGARAVAVDHLRRKGVVV